MIPLISFAAAVGFAPSDRPFAIVSTEHELRAAAGRTAREECFTIILKGRITLTSMVSIYGDSLSMIGVGDDAEIRFANPWDCNWAKLPPGNGIEIESNAANIRNIKFTGFEWQGSTIKWNADPKKSRLLLVDACQFVRCGRNWCPPRVAPPPTADDSHQSNVIGAHEQRNASVVVSHCVFDQCALASQFYGHCMYLGVRQISVVDCTFRSCGNPFQIGYSNTTFEADVFVSGNRIEPGEQSKDRAGVMQDPYFFVFGRRSRYVLVGNSLAGRWQIPMTGYYSRADDVVGFNDWRRSTIPGSMATDLETSRYISLEQWKRFEFESLWPTSQPVRP